MEALTKQTLDEYMAYPFIPALRRHREACMLLARVERKQGKLARAAQLVTRARRVNRDIVFFINLGVSRT